MDEKNAFVIAETLALAFYNQKKMLWQAPSAPPVQEAENLPNEGKARACLPKSDGLVRVNKRSKRQGGIDPLVVAQIMKLVSDAHKRGFLKIHMEWEAGGNDLKIRFREGGLGEEVPRALNRSLVDGLKMMANLDTMEKVFPQNGKARFVFKNICFEIQIAVLCFINGSEDIIVNILSAEPSKPEFIALADINFSRASQSMVESVITKTNGLVVVSGDRGSGKTTLLHAFLHFINAPGKRILAVENPVEIRQEGVRQIQPDTAKGLAFSHVLRTFLMGDSDVIMTGEIPDKEACRLVLAAAEDHLVLGSVESSSACEALRTLIALCADPARLAGATIISQKLVETLCPHCREEYNPSREEFDGLAEAFGAQAFASLGIEYKSDLLLKGSVGCKQCAYSGYKGQTGIQEVMLVTPDILSLARKESAEEKIWSKVIEKGMVNSKQDGILKVFQGVCDLKKILEVC